LSVTEAAFKYQYETVEAFSKAFKRMYDIPPSKLTKTDSHYRRFAPIKIN
jgi:AraC-like DNA-binding protein